MNLSERVVDAWSKRYLEREIFQERPAYCMLKLDRMIQAAIKRAVILSIPIACC